MKFKDYVNESKDISSNYPDLVQNVLKKTKKEIKGKFIEGEYGQVGVQYRVKRGWLPAYGKVNIGKSESMSVKEREKHVLDRIKQSLEGTMKKGEKIIEFSISYGAGKSKYGNYSNSKKINIKI